MSARREKRLRRMERTIKDQEKRIKALEKLAASPVTVVSSPSMQRSIKAPSVLEWLGKRWRVWKFCRKYLQPGVSREEAEAAFDSWKAIREGRERPKLHYIAK